MRKILSCLKHRCKILPFFFYVLEIETEENSQKNRFDVVAQIGSLSSPPISRNKENNSQILFFSAIKYRNKKT